MENFSILSLVGKGSFGRVFKATDRTNEATVALKIIVKKGRTKKEIHNLRGECEIQKHLNHPNIIRMIRSFETDNEIVVVTEYAHCDLHKLLSREGSIGEQRAQKLSYDLVSALYYLHSHRILHRDLKPQNILLGKDESAKLCDFGLARNMTIETHVLTSIKGTPLYMAPEIINEKPYDYQADLWSLGCILYETLAGEPPFSTHSIIRLALLIRDENVKWPTFLSDDCISFLKGLLEKEPSSRMNWNEILNHTFVKDKITILDEGILDSPFTSSTKKIVNDKLVGVDEAKQAAFTLKCTKNEQYFKNLNIAASSQDSMNVILQSDIEAIESENDEQSIVKSISSLAIGDIIEQQQIHMNDVCFVSGNQNLIVNHQNDNFHLRIPGIVPNNQIIASIDSNSSIYKKNVAAAGAAAAARQPNRSLKLEKRKLSQNLDNFSVKLGQELEPIAKYGIDINHTNANDTNKSQDIGKVQQKDKSPPPMLPGWDSCDEYQSPPIENDEWLAFLHRSMREILDGELDSLKQQNLVSIIVAPLRNIKASCKVIECVTQLLSLPLAINCSPEDVAEIRNVYVEVKLVPNLIYASKLLCSNKTNRNENEKKESSDVYRSVDSISKDELKSLLSLYELVCNLVHSNERSLSQFCDAIAILGASHLFVNFISNVTDNSTIRRLANLILSLLCYALRELPENASLVEKTIFNPKVNIISMMKSTDNLLRLRICMLLRMTGRFSCCALQSVWTVEMRDALEVMVNDANDDVRNEAEEILNELKHLSFFL